MTLADPAAVAECIRAGVGQPVSLVVGESVVCDELFVCQPEKLLLLKDDLADVEDATGTRLRIELSTELVSAPPG